MSISQEGPFGPVQSDPPLTEAVMFPFFAEVLDVAS